MVIDSEVRSDLRHASPKRTFTEFILQSGLSQIIGQQYAVLMGYLIDHRDALGVDQKDFVLVKNTIQEELHNLQDRAHREAKQLLSESPGAFIKL